MNIEAFWEQYNELAEMENSYEKYNLGIDLLTWSLEKEYLYEEFACRFELLNCATSLGEYELLFDHYSWCLDFFENNEEHLEEWVYQILWAFKWMLEHIVKFPHVQEETIQDLFSDYEALLERYQYSKRPYWQFQYKASLLAGDLEKAEEYYQLWINSERDDISDCAACELQSQMEYLFQIGKTDEALQLAERLLKREVTCGEIPNLTYSKLLLPYLKLGKTEKARFFQSEGYFMIYQQPHMLVEASEHLLYFALTNPKASKRIFDKHIGFADADKNPYGQFCFYLASLTWGKSMKKNGLRVPFSLNEMESVVLAIADDFDVRNGNEHFTNTVHGTLGLLETVIS